MVVMAFAAQPVVESVPWRSPARYPEGDAALSLPKLFKEPTRGRQSTVPEETDTTGMASQREGTGNGSDRAGAGQCTAALQRVV